MICIIIITHFYELLKFKDYSLRVFVFMKTVEDNKFLYFEIILLEWKLKSNIH